ncbi:X-Pro dipeptidyl-peptidase domain protein [Segniliparus rotundus DSM 44985]|uniref:X-Pro dipeptidyl-peptidase domain protein n=2 Tax=Segniliparus rotundus TaxID=286802 RepID=D6ZET4_SEGRD|nr:X-Pro dipeptidyl-peptidase domain protein [Segniliparus rotundus DSM 44985]
MHATQWNRTRGALGVCCAALLAASVVPSASGEPSGFTKRTLHFAVVIGPERDVDCDIVGDLYLPSDAGPQHRVPAIAATHGFGGSKEDQRDLGEFMTGRDYAVLAFSSLGFGGSTCRISMDTPAYDGVAVSQLISFLGGADKIAFEDAEHTRPAPVLDAIQLDAMDHTGRSSAHDPRVGMIGASYGGGVQFATASVDPRLDTIVPMITWNDSLYSLAPNNADLPVGVDERTPGPSKYLLAQDLLTNAAKDPDKAPPPASWSDRNCPRFYPAACQVILHWYITGAPSEADVESVRYGSVVTYADKIRIPTLLTQGQQDTVFLLNEAGATYQALAADGTEVKMLWHRWGHDSSNVVPGELQWAHPDWEQRYQVDATLRWFDHHLKGTGEEDLAAFSYFRDWIPEGSATSPWATSDRYPVAATASYCLSGDEALVPDKTAAATSVPPGAAPPGKAQSKTAQLRTGPGDESLAWSTEPLAAPLTVVGVPTVRIPVSADSTATVFLHLADVDPSGNEESIYRQVAPAKISGSGIVTFTLPGIVHQFPAGHRLRLVVTGSSAEFRGDALPVLTEFESGERSVLTLPVVP